MYVCVLLKLMERQKAELARLVRLAAKPFSVEAARRIFCTPIFFDHFHAVLSQVRNRSRNRDNCESN
jgi:hypothetical protein